MDTYRLLHIRRNFSFHKVYLYRDRGLPGHMSAKFYSGPVSPSTKGCVGHLLLFFKYQKISLEAKL